MPDPGDTAAGETKTNWNSGPTSSAVSSPNTANGGTINTPSTSNNGSSSSSSSKSSSSSSSKSSSSSSSESKTPSTSSPSSQTSGPNRGLTQSSPTTSNSGGKTDIQTPGGSNVTAKTDYKPTTAQSSIKVTDPSRSPITQNSTPSTPATSTGGTTSAPGKTDAETPATPAAPPSPQYTALQQALVGAISGPGVLSEAARMSPLGDTPPATGYPGSTPSKSAVSNHTPYGSPQVTPTLGMGEYTKWTGEKMQDRVPVGTGFAQSGTIQSPATPQRETVDGVPGGLGMTAYNSPTMDPNLGAARPAAPQLAQSSLPPTMDPRRSLSGAPPIGLPGSLPPNMEPRKTAGYTYTDPYGRIDQDVAMNQPPGFGDPRMSPNTLMAAAGVPVSPVASPGAPVSPTGGVSVPASIGGPAVTGITSPVPQPAYAGPYQNARPYGGYSQTVYGGPAYNPAHPLGTAGGGGVTPYNGNNNPDLGPPGGETQVADGGGTQTEITVDGGYPARDGTADPAPSQYDGPARDTTELGNRYDYEKDKLKQAVRDLPGKLLDAILGGKGITAGTDLAALRDARGGGGNPGQSILPPQQQPTAEGGDGASMSARLAAMGINPADQLRLILSTFV